MPMTIDQANALDIRPPMDIQIEMAAPTGETATITVSSTYKVYDEITGTTDIMVPLADLQGAGFPLDGTCYLEGATYPAGTKLGLRGTSGSALTMTASGYTGNGLTIYGKSGAVSVNGVQQMASLDGAAVIQASAGQTITFAAPDTDERAELRYVVPGVLLQLDNDDLNTVTVMLRGDLSILNPTLPVSEIEILAYSAADISTALSQVPDGTPITYSAGYDGEMSPERYFYVCEQITQTGNLIRIHAQDASAALEGEFMSFYSRTLARDFFKDIYNTIKTLIVGAGIQLMSAEAAPGSNGTTTAPRIMMAFPSEPRRNVIAFWMSRLRHTYTANLFNSGDEFFLDFVDAGRPALRWSKRTTSWSLDQEDCGDWQTSTERQLNKITQPVTRINQALSISDVEDRTSDPVGEPITAFFSDWYFMFNNDLKRDDLAQGLDWLMYEWTGISGSMIRGYRVIRNDTKAINTVSMAGFSGTVEYTPAVGTVATNTPNHAVAQIQAQDAGGTLRQIWPGAYTSAYLFGRSPKGGSFTFKGDPRWQPRDYATITLTDGTTKQVTLETLTITHQGGGTSEQVTYREGWI